MAETTADVRRDIELTRERMSDTLTQLEQKLNVMQVVKDNPWPALAVAVAAGALLAGSRSDVRAAAATVNTSSHRVESRRVETNLAKLGSLTFEEPDSERFPALRLARTAGEVGGTMAAVLNAANEVAVEAFCDRRIRFDQITETVARTMDRHQVVAHPALEQILEADTWARAEAGRGG